jgi:uncharacterized protein
MACAYAALMQQAQDKYFGKHQTVDNFPETDALTPDEAGFVALGDTFYRETGWPSVLHRGGPPGFVEVRLELSAIHHSALHCC